MNARPDDLALDRAAAADMLHRLAEPYRAAGDEGAFEIVGIHPDRDAGVPPRPRHFRLDEMDSAVDFAAALNAGGLNVYVGAGLRPDPPPGRASDKHVPRTRWLWADYDADGAAEAALARFGDLSLYPTMTIATGRTPCLRLQCWWRLAGPMDGETARATMKRIVEATGADPTPVNPSRVMRLAGSVAWPKPGKTGRVAEIAGIETANEHGFADIERQVDRLDPPRPVFATAGGLDFDDALRRKPGKEAWDERLEDALRRCGIDEQKHHGVRDASKMLAWQGRPRAEIESVLRAHCPVWDAKVEDLIDSAVRKYDPRAGTERTARRVSARSGGYAEEAASAFKPEAPLPTFRGSDFDGLPVPPRRWLVEDMIPMSQVTMLGGDGGTGKSLLALQLAVAVATGRAWLRRDVRDGGAFYLGAEDERDEMHRRLARIAEAEGVPLSEMERLELTSLAGLDALLAHLDPSGVLTPTALHDTLDAKLAEEPRALLVLDTQADLFPGNENDRAQARQFVQMLRGLAIRQGCAVVLLSHPSLTGMNTGSGASGSTGWSNSVRSRLYMERIMDGGYEPDSDARRLVVKKSNYGRSGAEIDLHWKDGAFVADKVASGLDRKAATAKAERVFLKLLRAFNEQGRPVSANPSSTHAPSVFAKEAGAEGCTKRAFTHAMSRLFDEGRIMVQSHGRAGRERSHLVEKSPEE